MSTRRRGAEVFASDLGAALSERGLDVRSVALAASDDPTALSLVALGQRRLGLDTLLGLRREIRRAGLVLAHGSTTLPACALGTLGTGTPFVYRNIGDPRYWAASPIRRRRSALLLSRAAAIAVLWEGAADAIVAQHRIPRSRIRVIPNGAPAVRFPAVDEPRRAAARAALGLPRDRQVVLYLGALSREKDVGTAVRAVAAVPDVALVVVGDGPERPALVALADELIPERVTFLGSVDDPAGVLAAADALVLPSRTEGMPGVLIEAGLSSLPVVATNVGGVAEIVEDGVTGRLVPPGDPGATTSALREVLANANGLGEAGRQRCLERFEMGVVADRWRVLLDDLRA